MDKIGIMKLKSGSLVGCQDLALLLARWLVIGFAIFQLGIALVGTAKYPGYASQHKEDFTPNDSWTPAETQLALKTLGLPVQTIGWIDLGSNIFVMIFCYSLGFILLRRKSQGAFSLFLAYVFFSMGGFNGSLRLPVVAESPVLFYFFSDIMGSISWQLFFIVFYLFPDGKPVPGWSRWIIFAWFIFIVTGVTPIADNEVFKSVSVVLGSSFVFAAVGSQIYRQWKHSSPIQVQQTKWVVYWLVIFALVLLPLAPITFRAPSIETIGRDLVIALVFQFLLITFMISLLTSFLIAILRYRLYDIDRIISRTLVYALLSGLLGLVYFGSVALLQGILTTGGRLSTAENAVGGPPSAVVIVITTLLIAALFNPLRIRLQNAIDRRFYRQKYDSEKALAEFATVARSEAELKQLSYNLTNTVNASLQPEKVTLWLKPAEVQKSNWIIQEDV